MVRMMSILAGWDDLAPGLGGEGPPDEPVDPVSDEPHGTVGEQHVDAAGVVAAGPVDEPVVHVPARLPVEPAAPDLVRAVVGGEDRVEHREPGHPQAPPPAPVVG